jgi:putative transposase
MGQLSGRLWESLRGVTVTVHLIDHSLDGAVSCRRRYAGFVHARRKRTGHFWQGRFGSVVMDEDHLAAAFRYISLNPVRARLVKRAQDWRWSSVRAHLGLVEDGLTNVRPALRRFPRFADLLDEPTEAEAFERLRRAETIGRPLGSPAFLARLERRLARSLAAKKRGPKPAPPKRKATGGTKE